MLNIIRNKMPALVLILSICISSLGINVHTHICHSRGSVDISIFEVHENGSCSICLEVNESCCIEQAKELSKDTCCEHKISFLKLLIETLTIEKYITSIDSYQNISLDYFNIFELSNIFITQKIATHYSGISPPVTNNFLHFISSLKE